VIGLIAAGRPGGGGSETYYTVPWCPMIARNPVAQMPGAALKLVRSVVAICRERGVHPSELCHVGPGQMLVAAMQTGKIAEAFIMQQTLRMMAELEMFPEPRP